MVVLLTSLSRQLLVASSQLVDKVKASVLGEELRDGGDAAVNLAEAISEMEKLGLGDPLANVDPNSKDTLKSSIDDMPSLTGVEALVYHVDRLFDLSSKNERKINTVVKQVLARKGNRPFVKSDLLSTGVYYLPHINRECKTVDRQIFDLMSSELEKTLTPNSELHDRLVSHFAERLESNSSETSNPIGKELNHTISSLKKYIADHSGRIRGIADSTPLPSSSSTNDLASLSSSSSSHPPPAQSSAQNSDDFVNMGVPMYFDKLKADIEQYSDLITVGIQMSFDPAAVYHTGAAGEKMGELVRTTIREVVSAHIYAPLISIFRTMNDKKDAEWVDHCAKLKDVMSAQLIGLSDEFWAVVTAPNALDEFLPICESFINSDTVRAKYDCLHRMSVCTQTIASNGLKKIAAAAGKPFDPTKPGDNMRFAVGADDFVPLFAYMVLQANLPDIHAQFAFLSVFTDENALIGRYGYYLASLQTAMMVISGLDASKPIPNGGTPSNAITIDGFTLVDGDKASETGSAKLLNSNPAQRNRAASSSSSSSYPAHASLQPSRSSFFRTSKTVTDLTWGADPLSRDDWDSDGNISSDDENGGVPDALNDIASNASTPPTSIRDLRLKKKAAIAVTGSLSSKEISRQFPSSDSEDISASLASKSMTDLGRASPSTDSPIFRSSSAVLREQQMPSIIVLNGADLSPSQLNTSLVSEHAYGLSLKMFTLILLLYQRYENRLLAQNQSGGFGSSGPSSSEMQNSPLPQSGMNTAHNDELFKNYKEETLNLRKVQLHTMTDAQRLVFFLNTFHALQMHAYLEASIPNSLQERIQIMATFAYTIGDQNFTLLEIEHGILRHWSTYPNELLDGLFHFPAKWKTSDFPKSKFAMRRAEPRINFVLSPLALSGPPLRIYTVETLEQALQAATESYLRKNVLVSPDNSVIILPKQIYWYAREFGRRDKNIIDWVSRYLEPSQQEMLLHSKKEALRIKYNEYDWTFVFSFESVPDQ